MQLPLALQLALRFSRSRKQKSMVSLISLLSTLGIVLGVAVLIIGLSAMNGFEYQLKNRVLAVVPQGELQAVQPPMHDWRATMEKVRQVDGVTGVAPYINLTGLLESDSAMQSVQVKGVDVVKEQQLTALPAFVLDNAWQHFQAGKQQIILGSGLAKQLHLQQGDSVTLVVPTTQQPQQKLLPPQRYRLQVAGILQLSGQLDHHFALIPLADAQHYLSLGDNVTGIAIKVNDLFKADKIVYQAAQASGQYVYYSSWINRYGYMYQDIQLIRHIMYIAMVLVIGVACFNIVSTLVMAVKEKSEDIAILRTLGGNNRLIRQIFLYYGLLSGFLGCLLGVLLGVVVAQNLTALFAAFSRLTGHSLLSGDIYFIDFIPSQLHGQDIVLVLMTALSLSVLASWYPASRACQLQPARVLSGQ